MQVDDTEVVENAKHDINTVTNSILPGESASHGGSPGDGKQSNQPVQSRKLRPRNEGKVVKTNN